MTLQEFNKRQDSFLIELNRLSGLDDYALFDQNRPIIEVNPIKYQELQMLANRYLNFIIEEARNNSDIVFDPQWLFKQINKFYILK